MSEEPCWCLAPDGNRCRRPAEPESHFCRDHRRIRDGGGPHPLSIWRAPVDQMPPDLLAIIRAYSPEITFPTAPPAPPVSAAPTASEPPAAAEPLERPDGADSGASPYPDAAGSACPPGLRVDTDPSPVDWLQDALRQAVDRVMAAEADPLKQANTLVRLGGLFMKTCQFQEQKRAHSELTRANRDLQRDHAVLAQRHQELQRAHHLLSEESEELRSTRQELLLDSQELAQRAARLEARVAALEAEAAALPSPAAPERAAVPQPAVVAGSVPVGADPAVAEASDPAGCASSQPAAAALRGSSFPLRPSCATMEPRRAAGRGGPGVCGAPVGRSLWSR